MKHISAAVLCTFSLAPAQTFDAASVKPSPSAGGRFTMSGGPGTNDPGRISYTNIPLRMVLLNAYGVKNYQLNGPDWLNTLRFDIAATIPPSASKDEVQAMLQHLVETRFHIVLHREVREMAIFNLLPAKRGVKLKSVAAQSTEGQLATVLPGASPDGFPKVLLPSPGLIIETKDGVARITAKEATMEKFADMLTGQSHRPVFDRTGLPGVYDFVVYFTPEGAATGDRPDPDLFSAIDEQLGLRLEPAKGPVEYLVIDHAEKTPTEN